MSPFAVAATVVWPLVLGAGLLRLARVPRALDPLAWWGWAWAAGALATGLAVYAWAWTGAPFSGVTWVVPALGVLAWAPSLRRPRAGAPALPPPLLTPEGARPRGTRGEEWIFRAVLALAVLLVAHRILAGSIHGIVGDDELYLWARKAKLIFQAGGFGEGFRALATQRADPLLHADYPLLSPLLQIWVYAHAGEVTHFASRLPVQGFAVALVLVAASALRRRARPGVAALLLLLVVSLPQMAASMRRASADVMVGAGLLIAADALLRRREEVDPARRAAIWRVACIGLAAMLWSKNEAMLYLAAICAGALAAALPPRRAALAARSLGRETPWLALPLGILVLHRATNAVFGFRNDLLAGDDFGKPFWVLAFERMDESLPVVAGYFWNTVLLDPRSNQWLVLLVLAAALAAPRAAFGRHRAATVAALAALAGIFLVYAGTPKGGGEELRAILPPGEGARWHLNNSAPRILMQITPALALVLALALRPGAGPREEIAEPHREPVQR